MFLQKEAQKEFLKTKFHQYFDIHINNTNREHQNLDFANLVFPLDKFNDLGYDVTLLKNKLNEKYDNIIFSSQDDNYIYDYEIYKDTYFIKVNPFSWDIRMHIIPKKYTVFCDPVLIFKDSDYINNEDIFINTEEYKREDNNTINAIYDETDENLNSSALYKFDIRNKTKGLKGIQIDMRYSYNDMSPINKIKHFTGILDESDEEGNRLDPNNFTSFNNTLYDANYENNPDSFDSITDEIRLLKHPQNNNVIFDPFDRYETSISNIHMENTFYHKTLKYFNDDLYVEENGQSHIQYWNDVGDIND